MTNGPTESSGYHDAPGVPSANSESIPRLVPPLMATGAASAATCTLLTLLPCVAVGVHAESPKNSLSITTTAPTASGVHV